MRLQDIKLLIDQEMLNGIKSRKHGFHLLNLASLAGDSPNVRTLVLRGYDHLGQLQFHSHFHSAKIQEFKSCAQACVHAYCKDLNIQLRFFGRVEVDNSDPLLAKKWQDLSVSARRCYLAAKPGAQLSAPGSGYDPRINQDQGIDKSETEYAKDNMVFIKVNFSKIDFLKLSAQGHIRALLTKQDNAWLASWIVP